MNEQFTHRASILPVSDGVDRPLWSVMIPTYNCANYLRQTLASVLAQDPGPEVMQIEVVDDGSTKDDPAAVVEELGRGRVSFYRQPENVGFIRNFETCLQRSRGKLIHLLHGDDCVLDGFYSKLQKAFEQNPEIGAAFCRHIYMDEHSHWQRISELEQPESGIISDWLEKIAAGQRLTTPSIVVRREVYEELGGFDRRISCCGEDWEMWVRIATRHPVWYEVEPLAAYRLKASKNLASSSVCSGGYIRDMRIATEIIETYLPTYLPQNASQLTNKARKTYAHWALGTYYLPGTARQMLIEGDVSSASALVREALKCSHSLGIIKAIVYLFLWAGARWLWWRISSVISLCRNPVSLMELYIRPLILKTSIKHIYGLKKIDYATDELIVLSVVRNGELYIKSFIEHYLSLGVKHIVFLDNNSTDDTLAIAQNYNQVTILQTKCPYSKYETLMKKYLANRFSKNKWNLFADIDELFDYPYSDVISIKLLLTYLNNNSYTAVVAQMLDLFSDKNLAELNSHKNDSLKEKYTYYDISNIYKDGYPYGTASNKNVNRHWGGIRKTLFGTNNCLTKAALVFLDKKINIFADYHHVDNGYIADFTCVLLHYPFLSSFYDKVKDAVKTDRYAISASHEYEMYWHGLKKDPGLNIKQETACKLENVNSLVEKDFLFVSEKYIYWVKTNSQVSQIEKSKDVFSPQILI